MVSSDVDFLLRLAALIFLFPARNKESDFGAYLDFFASGRNRVYYL